MLTILLVLLVLMLVGAMPQWPHAKNWGYSPFGVILVLIIVLLLVGAI